MNQDRLHFSHDLFDGFDTVAWILFEEFAKEAVKCLWWAPTDEGSVIGLMDKIMLDCNEFDSTAIITFAEENDKETVEKHLESLNERIDNWLKYVNWLYETYREWDLWLQFMVCRGFWDPPHKDPAEDVFSFKIDKSDWRYRIYSLNSKWEEIQSLGFEGRGALVKAELVDWHYINWDRLVWIKAIFIKTLNRLKNYKNHIISAEESISVKKKILDNPQYAEDAKVLAGNILSKETT